MIPIVVTAFLVLVTALIVVLTWELARQHRTANAATEANYAPTLYRTRLMTAGRRPQSDWSSANRRVSSADSVATHRRRGEAVTPVPAGPPVVGVCGVAPGVRVDPHAPVVDVPDLPAPDPALVDIEAMRRELAEWADWVQSPDRTGRIPRVLS